MHELKTHQHAEQRQQEGRETKVDRHEPIGDDGTPGAAIVLKLSSGIDPFSLLQIFQYTLVGCPRIEKRHHSNDDVNRCEEEN